MTRETGAGKLTMAGAAKLSCEWTLDEARLRDFVRAKEVEAAFKRRNARPTLLEGLRGIGQVGVAIAKRYAVSLGQLEPLLVGKHLDEIDRKLFAEIEQARRVEGVTNATIKRDLAALSCPEFQPR
jgi:hypothetical protein